MWGGIECPAQNGHVYVKMWLFRAGHKMPEVVARCRVMFSDINPTFPSGQTCGQSSGKNTNVCWILFTTKKAGKPKKI